MSGPISGGEVCARCHAEIYKKYSTTPMALSSGRAIPVGDKASFSGNSGYQYSIVPQDQKLFLEFHKTDKTERRELAYFVGSGATARSYLISIDGFLYEALATYYNRSRAWALSP